MAGWSRRAQACVCQWLFLSLEKRKETTTDASAQCEVLACPHRQHFQEASTRPLLKGCPGPAPSPQSRTAAPGHEAVPRGRGCLPTKPHRRSCAKKGEVFERAGFFLLAARCRGLWLGSARAVLPLRCQVRYGGRVLVSLSGELIM